MYLAVGHSLFRQMPPSTMVRPKYALPKGVSDVASFALVAISAHRIQHVGLATRFCHICVVHTYHGPRQQSLC